ncbi:MAG: biotin/lipoyl-containing protein, partial [Nitrososphaerales archaeon]
MPKLGAGVYHEGVILRWMKAEGDHVRAEEPIAEIETDKAVATYQSPAAGTVLKLLFREGDTVEVGTPILILGQPGEEVPAGLASGAGTPGSQPSPERASAALQPPQGAPQKAPEVSPAAGRL